MNTRVGPDVGAIRDLDVAGKRRGVGHNYLAPDLTIVSDVRLRHKKVVVADLRQPTTARCPAMDRDKLADLISLSDLGRRFLAGVLQVLRGQAERYEWENMGLISDSRNTINDDV